MSKPEPLFPAAANCPDCGKKIRIKWAGPRAVAPGLNGLGHMKCLHCGANHLRAVGPAPAVEETSRLYEMQYQQACGHDHGDDPAHDHADDHGHDHSHGVVVIPGGDTFSYIKLPG